MKDEQESLEKSTEGLKDE